MSMLGGGEVVSLLIMRTLLHRGSTVSLVSGPINDPELIELARENGILAVHRVRVSPMTLPMFGTYPELLQARLRAFALRQHLSPR